MLLQNKTSQKRQKVGGVGKINFLINLIEIFRGVKFFFLGARTFARKAENPEKDAKHFRELLIDLVELIRPHFV